MIVRCDVAIVGGGAAGLLTAIAMLRQGLSVQLVDPLPAEAIRAAPADGRAVGLHGGSIDHLQKLGVWPRLEPFGSPIRRLEVHDDGSTGKIVYREGDRPGGQLFGSGFENRVLRGALLDVLLAQAGGGKVLVADRLAEIRRQAEAITIRCESGREFSARLVIGADGRASRLRALAKIALQRWSYPNTALAFIVRHSVDQCGTVIEHLRKGGPIATLPLRGDRTGITWVEEHQLAQELADAPATILLGELDRVVNGALGTTELDGPVGTWPLSGQHAQRYVAPRLALVGDAAHGVHPIHAQGFNMGVADVAMLADLAGSADDPGAPDVLRRFERARRPANIRSIRLTDGLARVFSNDLMPLAKARGAALSLLDRITPLRRMAIREGMRG